MSPNAAGHLIADEFDGEVYFVELGSLTDPDHVASAIATSLGLGQDSGDGSLQVVDLVRSRKLLIILDSCEHTTTNGSLVYWPLERLAYFNAIRPRSCGGFRCVEKIKIGKSRISLVGLPGLEPGTRPL
jgi:hypothetical protein